MNVSEQADLLALSDYLEDAQRRYYGMTAIDADSFLNPEVRAGVITKMRAAASDAVGENAFGAAALEVGLREAEPAWDDAARRALTQAEDPIYQSVLSDLVARIEPAVARLGLVLPHPLHFGTLPTGRVNGQAIAIRGNRFRLIVIESGIFGFANLVTKALAACFPVVERADVTRYETDPSLVSAHLAAHPAAFRRFYEAVVAYVLMGDPHYAPPYLPDASLVAMSSAMRQGMETFVLTHEYGHCIAGHIDDDRSSIALPASDAGAAVEISMDWKDEFEADAIGLSIALEVMRERGYDLAISLLGVYVFFAASQSVECATQILATGAVDLASFTDLSGSHPPARLRWNCLMRGVADGNPALKSEIEACGQLHRAVEHAFTTLWDRLEPAIKALHARGCRPSSLWSHAPA